MLRVWLGVASLQSFLNPATGGKLPCIGADIPQGLGYSKTCDFLVFNQVCTQLCNPGYVGNFDGAGLTYRCPDGIFVTPSEALQCDGPCAATAPRALRRRRSCAGHDPPSACPGLPRYCTRRSGCMYPHRRPRIQRGALRVRRRRCGGRFCSK